ncbi:XRE family transcriptional regulator [Zavarzinia sp.]|uniref:XRE family transcriptional regulator n=1 Tax=Zavarzinia sp. TaxID=2027920 RepID=UPI003566C02E
MNPFAERLRAAIRRSGKKKSQIADAAGMSAVQLSQYLAGNYVAKAEVAARLAAALGVQVRWLMDGTIEEKTPSVTILAPGSKPEKMNKRQTGTYYLLPLISGEAAAGSPSEVDELQVEDWIPSIFNSDWCPHPDRTVCVRVRGDSMEPTIPDGGLVAVDLEQRDPRCLLGKIAAIRHDGGVAIKRIFQAENHAWVARPDNLSSSEIFVFTPDEIVEKIVGKIVFWWGKS